MQEPDFDIKFIIELLKEQVPKRLDVIAQLEKSNNRKLTRQPYVHFVSSERANQPGAEWQFKESIVLEHELEGTIVIDVLQDDRIGGIEFVSQIKEY